jgi:hypothetical protein
MRAETLDGHHGRAVAIDLCLSCQSFWFDSRESLQLSPGSTLKLFRIIGEHTASARPGTGEAAACPHCRAKLRRTRDMQRATRFEYLNCPRGHGRLTTFFNFLKEKNFIKPLSAAQLGELRKNVQSVSCSNCGAPVDVGHAAACAHCGAALSMLDLTQAEKLIGELREADQRKRTVDAARPLSLAHSRRDVHAAFDAFERDRDWFDGAGSTGLVGAGLAFVARWLGEE